MYDNYDTIPFKLFFKILNDESNIKLLGFKSSKKGLEVWESIKNEYAERNPDPRTIEMLASFKKVLTKSIELNKTITLLEFLKGFQGNPEIVYQELKIPYSENESVRLKKLESAIKKHRNQLEIYDAQHSNLLKTLNKKKKVSKPIDISKINENIAALEEHGYSIPNYEELSMGRYDALLKRIARNGQRNNNR